MVKYAKLTNLFTQSEITQRLAIFELIKHYNQEKYLYVVAYLMYIFRQKLYLNIDEIRIILLFELKYQLWKWVENKYMNASQSFRYPHSWIWCLGIVKRVWNTRWDFGKCSLFLELRSCHSYLQNKGIYWENVKY